MFCKIKSINITTIIFVLVATAASTSLTDTTLNRNAFYLAVILAPIVFIFSPQRKITREGVMVSLAVFLVGLGQYVWQWRFPSSGPLETNMKYLGTVIRLMSGALLIFTLASLRTNLTASTIRLIKYLVVIGFFYTAVKGLYYHFLLPDTRLGIKTVATMTAYIFVLQSLLAIYVLTTLSFRLKPVILTFAIILSLWVVMLTETRTAMLSYPVFLLLLFFRRHHLSAKTLLLTCVIAVLATAASGFLFDKATQRLAGSVTELNNYQKGDGDSSLGARISMWKTGISAFRTHPTGQSADTRLQEAEIYINQHEGGNPEALRSLVYHLHNDFIDTASLQGFTGIIILLLFFGLIAYGTWGNSCYKPIVLLLLLPVALIGLVDTLFIDRGFVTSLVLLLTLYLCLQSPGIDKNICKTSAPI